VRQWRFSFEHPDAPAISEALQAAVASLRDLPTDVAPTSDTGRAVVAVQIVDLFLRRDDAGQLSVVRPSVEEVRDAVTRLAATRETG
jgi:hypothetical protein